MTKIQIETISDQKMEQLISKYSYQRPKKGDFLEAEVMQIEHDHILVDLGAKSDAVITPRELNKTSDELLDSLTVGDTVPVYVLRGPGLFQKPRVSIQRGIEKADWDRAENLRANGQSVKLEIVGKNKGGLLIRFGRLEGFLPASLMPTVARAGNRKIAEQIKANLVGESLYLKAIRVDAGRKKLIFSAREDQDELTRQRMDELQPGDTVSGIVANLVDFGAFVDLLGIDGLLHISEIDYARIEHPSEIFNLGEKVEILILSVDYEKNRVSLSRKALLDPIEAYAIEETEAQV